MRRIIVFLCVLALVSMATAGDTVSYKTFSPSTHLAKPTMSYVASTAGVDSCDTFWGTTGGWSGIASSGDPYWTFIVHTTEAYGAIVDYIRVAPLYIVGSAAGDTLCGEFNVEDNGTSILPTTHTFDGSEITCDVALGELPRADGARLLVSWTDAATTNGTFNLHFKGPKK
jgi:hypothetical protein